MSTRNTERGTRNRSPIEPIATGIRLRVHVQPRASRTELAGMRGSELKVRLTAPPVDGAANEELIRFLAQVLGVPRSAVTLTAGTAARSKCLEVTGVTLETGRKLLLLGEG